jgi:hypothetical protein
MTARKATNATWPKEAFVFMCVDDMDVFNDFWAGKIVEMAEFEIDGELSVRIRRLECDHFGYMNNVDGLVPLTPAAEAMLAIAKAGA